MAFPTRDMLMQSPAGAPPAFGLPQAGGGMYQFPEHIVNLNMERQQYGLPVISDPVDPMAMAELDAAKQAAARQAIFDRGATRAAAQQNAPPPEPPPIMDQLRGDVPGGVAEDIQAKQNAAQRILRMFGLVPDAATGR